MIEESKIQGVVYREPCYVVIPGTISPGDIIQYVLWHISLTQTDCIDILEVDRSESDLSAGLSVLVLRGGMVLVGISSLSCHI